MNKKTNRIFFAAVFTLAGVLTTGCDSGGITPNSKAVATRQWNDARANLLISLASDQYKSGTLDKCQETLEQALRLAPQNPTIHILAAKLAIEQGKLEVADAQLAEARRLDPKNGEVDYLMGVVLQRWQQNQKAFDAYSLAVTKCPDELSYLLAKAEMLVVMDRSSDALQLLQEKAAYFEHSGVLRDEMGQILAQLKEYPRAIDEFRQASILASDDDSIREHLAFALLESKQYSEASDLFDRLLKEPGYSKRADILAALGGCQSENHQLTDAAGNFRAATELNSHCSGYWIGLGKVAMQQGDLATAESAARRATATDANSSEAQCLLGYVRLKENQLPESLAAFRVAADLNPTDSLDLCLQGYVLARMGKADQAREMYSKALTINPQDSLAGHLMASLDSHD